MFVNKYQINTSTLSSGATATTINIPITLEYQMVDQAEIVDRVFVSTELEKAVNPIVDYEKTRFIPIDQNGNQLNKVIYNVSLVSGSTYGSNGFTDDDIRFRKEAFKQTFVDLRFYDSDNPLTQRLVNSISLYPILKSVDLYPIGSLDGIVGQPIPVDEIQISFVLENPLYNDRGNAQGFYLYDYKDELSIDEEKYLYMRGVFNNAKTGSITNLMVKDYPLPIDTLIHELYTRFKLKRTENGYFYEVDSNYQGSEPDNTTPAPNNVSYTTNSSMNTVIITLNQIQAI